MTPLHEYFSFNAGTQYYWLFYCEVRKRPALGSGRSILSLAGGKQKWTVLRCVKLYYTRQSPVEDQWDKNINRRQVCGESSCFWERSVASW